MPLQVWRVGFAQLLCYRCQVPAPLSSACSWRANATEKREVSVSRQGQISCGSWKSIAEATWPLLVPPVHLSFPVRGQPKHLNVPVPVTSFLQAQLSHRCACPGSTSFPGYQCRGKHVLCAKGFRIWVSSVSPGALTSQIVTTASQTSL